jgi:hypothetical protein
VHGGASLQELIIPLITVRKKRATDVRDVNVDIIPMRSISTNRVNVSLYQSEVVDEKLNQSLLKYRFKVVMEQYYLMR